MTLRERVAHTGQVLSAIAVGRSFLLGATTGLLAFALAFPLATGTRGRAIAAIAFAGVVALAVAVLTYRRIRGPGISAQSVGLWLEERIPSLGYRLVTALEDGAPGALERSVASVDWKPTVSSAARKALLVPALSALAAIGLVAASLTFAPAVSRLASRIAPGPRVAAGPLDVTVRVTPPAYTRRRAESFRNPPVIRALVGSEVRLSVAGRDSVMVDAGEERFAAGTPWRVGARPIALRVRSGSDSRLISVDPVLDSVPAVHLRLPARDTVLAVPTAVLTLGADVRDDLGIGRAAFEYIVSSGSGESFAFTSGYVGSWQPEGARTTTLSSQFSLVGMNLKPGDFIHLRAIATDLRDDTAAARGASETRTIRIARTGEYDSVSVEAAAPPEEDKAVLSQRMLINLAEALVKRRRQIDRGTFSQESRTIAKDQGKLRKQVGEIVFARLGDDPSGEHFHGDGHEHSGQELRPAMTPEEVLKAAENAAASQVGKVLDFEGDETPVVAINRPLLEAYNFMWDAGRELEQSAPEKALPPMYRALEAIQRARSAERLYLRSRPPKSVVDVDRVRLQGKDK